MIQLEIDSCRKWLVCKPIWRCDAGKLELEQMGPVVVLYACRVQIYAFER